eukprot:CAMPEP_0203746906 /NCGR_PEP_ID=MMETSP0098-20131031/2205_1 /ASSEMBLY_ACC=CAM_ASM_000208 /TAXON_ID=96639 /ORGANISM=" , Strain NY0313808BC1" /LENGTH=2314 /DNA_ID=CAMNT_0050635159 /DNA_START=256 /DNA_END=7200 /DNA_ORIENTATION=-
MDLLTGLSNFEDDEALLGCVREVYKLLTLGQVEIRVSPFAQALLKIMARYSGHSEIMLLAARSLILILDIEPQSSRALIADDGPSVICKILLEFKDFELAEQCVNFLHMLTKQTHKESGAHQRAVMRADGLNACLAFFDFFPRHLQVKAMETVARICETVCDKTSTVDAVRDAPNVLQVLNALHRYLAQSVDPQILRLVCLSIGRLVQSYNCHKDNDEQEEYKGWRQVMIGQIVTEDVSKTLLSLLKDDMNGNSNVLDLATLSLVTRTLSCATHVFPERVPELVQCGIVDLLRKRFSTVDAADFTLDSEGTSSNINLIKLHRLETDIVDTLDLVSGIIPPLPETILPEASREFKTVLSEGTMDVKALSKVPESKENVESFPDKNEVTSGMCSIWACPTCTFHNESGKSSCEMCGQICPEIQQQAENRKGTQRPILDTILAEYRASKSVPLEKVLETQPKVLCICINVLSESLLKISSNSSLVVSRERALRQFAALTYFAHPKDLVNYRTDSGFSSKHCYGAVASALRSIDGSLVKAALDVVFVDLLRIPKIISSTLKREGIVVRLEELVRLGLHRKRAQESLVLYHSLPTHGHRTDDILSKLRNVCQSLIALGSGATEEQKPDPICVFEKPSGTRSLRKKRRSSSQPLQPKFPAHNAGHMSKKRKLFPTDQIMDTCGILFEGADRFQVSSPEQDEEQRKWIAPLMELKNIVSADDCVTLYEMDQANLVNALQMTVANRAGEIAFSRVFFSDMNNAHMKLFSRLFTLLNSNEQFKVELFGGLRQLLRSVYVSVTPSIDLRVRIRDILLILFEQTIKPSDLVSKTEIKGPLEDGIGVFVEPLLLVSDIQGIVWKEFMSSFVSLVQQTELATLRLAEEYLVQKIQIGDIVKCGRDWKWGKPHDHRGVVVESNMRWRHDSAGGAVLVIWDHLPDQVELYRYGADFAYDVQVVTPPLSGEAGKVNGTIYVIDTEHKWRSAVICKRVGLDKLEEMLLLKYNGSHEWLLSNSSRIRVEKPESETESSAVAEAIFEENRRLLHARPKVDVFHPGTIVDAKCKGPLWHPAVVLRSRKSENCTEVLVHDLSKSSSCNDAWVSTRCTAPVLTNSCISNQNAQQVEKTISYEKLLYIIERTARFDSDAAVNRSGDTLKLGDVVFTGITGLAGIQRVACRGRVMSTGLHQDGNVSQPVFAVCFSGNNIRANVPRDQLFSDPPNGSILLSKDVLKAMVPEDRIPSFLREAKLSWRAYERGMLTELWEEIEHVTTTLEDDFEGECNDEEVADGTLKQALAAKENMNSLGLPRCSMIELLYGIRNGYPISGGPKSSRILSHGNAVGVVRHRKTTSSIQRRLYTNQVLGSQHSRPLLGDDPDFEPTSVSNHASMSKVCLNWRGVGLRGNMMMLEALQDATRRSADKKAPRWDGDSTVSVEFNLDTRNKRWGDVLNEVFKVGSIVELSGKFRNILHHTLSVESHFPTLSVLGSWVSSGSWYYEVHIVCAGLAQIGWSGIHFNAFDSKGVGCGDDKHSWAFDGNRRMIWNVTSSHWGTQWKTGDVVGCAVTIDDTSHLATMSFALNGQWDAPMGIAYKDIPFSGPALRPTVTFNNSFQCKVVIGGQSKGAPPLKYPPPKNAKPIFCCVQTWCESVLSKSKDKSRSDQLLTTRGASQVTSSSSNNVPSTPKNSRDISRVLNLLRDISKLHASNKAHTWSMKDKRFFSQRLTQKFVLQIQDVLSVCSNALPNWVWCLAQDYKFLIPLEARMLLFETTSFGIARAIHRLKECETPADASVAAENQNQVRIEEDDDEEDGSEHDQEGHATLITHVSSSNASPSRKEPTVLTGVRVLCNIEGSNRGQLGMLRKQKAVVPRRRVLEAAMFLMCHQTARNFVLSVEFSDETGHGQGPTLEFYSLVCKSLQRADLRLWRSETVTSSSSSPTSSNEAEVNYVFSSNGLWPCALAESLNGSNVGKKTDLSGNSENSSSPSNEESDDMLNEKETSDMDTAGEDGGDLQTIETVIENPDDVELEGKSCILGAQDTRKRSLRLFRFMGRFIGKALQDKRLLDLPFSLPLCKVILGAKLGLDDIALVDKQLGESLKQIRIMGQKYNTALKHKNVAVVAEISKEVKHLCLDFTVPGNAHLELVEGGSDKDVTAENLTTYIDLVADRLLVKDVEEQISELKRGIEEFLPLRALNMFSPSEFQCLLSGGNNNESWDASVIAHTIVCKHGYSSDSPQIVDLVKVLSDFDQDDRRLFMQFLTGSPRLPIGGFSELQPAPTVVRKNCSIPDDNLPSCSTCQVYLKLPAYTSRAILEQRLKQAIREGQGHFALD